jgi:flagellar protein FliS
MKITESYSDIELTTEVMSASNHRLIQMLFDKGLQHIRLARNSVAENDLVKRNYHITKASDIIAYLRECLNFEDKNAVDLAKLLDSIYVFIEQSLLNVTLKNEVKSLNDSEKALSILKSGWDGINA